MTKLRQEATFTTGTPKEAVFYTELGEQAFYQGDFKLDDDGFITRSGTGFTYSSDDVSVPETIGEEGICFKLKEFSEAADFLTVRYKRCYVPHHTLQSSSVHTLTYCLF